MPSLTVSSQRGHFIFGKTPTWEFKFFKEHEATLLRLYKRCYVEV